MFIISVYGDNFNDLILLKISFTKIDFRDFFFPCCISIFIPKLSVKYALENLYDTWNYIIKLAIG